MRFDYFTVLVNTDSLNLIWWNLSVSDKTHFRGGKK
jgi:hypothetical protein